MNQILTAIATEFTKHLEGTILFTSQKSIEIRAGYNYYKLSIIDQTLTIDYVTLGSWFPGWFPGWKSCG